MKIKNFRAKDENDYVEISDYDGFITYLDIKVEVAKHLNKHHKEVQLIYDDKNIDKDNEIVSLNSCENLKYILDDLNLNPIYIKINHHLCSTSKLFKTSPGELVNTIESAWLKDCFPIKSIYHADVTFYNQNREKLNPDSSIGYYIDRGEFEFWPVVNLFYENEQLIEYFIEIPIQLVCEVSHLEDIVRQQIGFTNHLDNKIQIFYYHHRLNSSSTLTECHINPILPLTFKVQIRKCPIKLLGNDKKPFLFRLKLPPSSTIREVEKRVQDQCGIKSQLNFSVDPKSEILPIDTGLIQLGYRDCQFAFGISHSLSNKCIAYTFKKHTSQLFSMVSDIHEALFKLRSLCCTRIDKKYLNVIKLNNEILKIEFNKSDSTEHIYSVVRQKTQYRLKLFYKDKEIILGKKIDEIGLEENDYIECVKIRKIEVEFQGKVSSLYVSLRDIVLDVILKFVNNEQLHDYIVLLNSKQIGLNVPLYKLINYSIVQLRIYLNKITIYYQISRNELFPISMLLTESCMDLYHKVESLNVSEITGNHLALNKNLHYIPKNQNTLFYEEAQNLDVISYCNIYIETKVFYRGWPAIRNPPDSFRIPENSTGKDLIEIIQNTKGYHSQLRIKDLFEKIDMIDQKITSKSVFYYYKIDATEIVVKMPDGRHEKCDIDDKDTISSFRILLEDQFDCIKEGIMQCRIFFKDRQLEDFLTFRDCGIRQHDLILLKPSYARIKLCSKSHGNFYIDAYGNETTGDLINKLRVQGKFLENVNLTLNSIEYGKSKLLYDLKDGDVLDFEVKVDPNVLKVKEISEESPAYLNVIPVSNIHESSIDCKSLTEFVQSKHKHEDVQLVFFRNCRQVDKKFNISSTNFHEIEYVATQQLQENIDDEIEEIGSGSFGSVEIFKESDAIFAIKRFKFDKNPATVYDSFKREINYSRITSLDSEHLVKIYGICKIDDGVCIKMEYVKNGSLKTYVKDKNFKLTEEEISKFSLDICQGIKCLHDKNIMHRDIKCDNVLLDLNLVAKLCDFGLIKLPVNDDREKFLQGYEQTSCGTLNFMAPEVIEKSVYGPKADIYSFGATVYEMITGKPPFNEFPEQKILQTKKTPNSLRPLKVSRLLKEFYLPCLEPDISKRPNIYQLEKSEFLTLCIKRNVEASSS